MKKGVVLLVVLSAAIFFASCSSDEKTARVEVWLTDAPGDYDEVNVDIQGVEIHSDAGEQTKDWKSLDVKAGVYNLLDFTNGLETLLGNIEVPVGRISQVRLKLGNNNTLKIGSETYNLGTPSAQQSGLKLNVQQTLTEGITYKILLDFDAARSIVLTGNASYKLKPVIRTIVEAQSGAIKGMVTPKEATPAVYAIVGQDTVGTTFADANGAFLLKGIPAGTYKVTFSPATGYLETVKENVTVTVGNITDLQTVTIEQ